MKQYMVEVKCTSYETWLVDAESAEEAEASYYSGNLLNDNSDDYQVTSVVQSVNVVEDEA